MYVSLASLTLFLTYFYQITKYVGNLYDLTESITPTDLVWGLLSLWHLSHKFCLQHISRQYVEVCILRPLDSMAEYCQDIHILCRF